MANGDYVDKYGTIERIKFLDAQSTSASSPWREVIECKKRTFAADAIEVGATVDIMVLNSVTQPLSSTDGTKAATLTPTALAATLDDAYRWWKCKKTQGGAPAATTVLMEANHVGY